MMRKHYIDNLRWLMLLVLIPYHAAQAWNTWGEPNYIFFEGNQAIGSIIVFFSPYFMPLLFALPVTAESGEIIDYNMFQALLIVRYASDGKLYLYDIQNIKKETRYPSWTTRSDGQKPASSD